MKKLVKTAKQQFNKRLAVLGNPSPVEIMEELFYSTTDSQGVFRVLSENDKTHTYSEYVYDVSLCDIFEDEVFLKRVFDYILTERPEAFKDLLSWYASADKDNPPFDELDLVSYATNYKKVEYKDLYEEVPNSMFVSAKDKWEKECGDLGSGMIIGGDILKFRKADDDLILYIGSPSKNRYSKVYYPPFSELQTDGDFISSYIKEVSKTHPDDLPFALKWLNGEDYTMSDASLIDITTAYTNVYGEPCEEIVYSDERLSIEQMLDLTPEQAEAVGMIENGLRELKRLGGVVFQYHDNNEFYVVNGNGLEFDSANGSFGDKLEECGFKDVTYFVENLKLDFKVDHWIVDCAMYAAVKS